MTRPKKAIDARQVEKLAAIGCTNVEIADVFAVSEGTIRNRFYENLAKGRTQLKQKLRRKQMAVAMKGNVAMLIFLGKQYLEQSDKQEIGGTDGKPLRVEITAVNYRVAIANLAPRPVADCDASGQDQSALDGAPVGQIGDGRSDLLGDSRAGGEGGLDRPKLPERAPALADGGIGGG